MSLFYRTYSKVYYKIKRIGCFFAGHGPYVITPAWWDGKNVRKKICVKCDSFVGENCERGKMKKKTVYEIELTDEESEAIDDGWEYNYHTIINDPWRGTKEMLMDFFSDFEEGIEEGCELPEYWPHLLSIKEKIKDLKKDDWIEMVVGL